jgi:hypothetical protein
MKDFVYDVIDDIVCGVAMYEQNCQRTWDLVGQKVRETTNKLASRGYLNDTMVICDGTINGAHTIVRNELHLKFLWRVTEDSPMMATTFVLSPTGIQHFEDDYPFDMDGGFESLEEEDEKEGA